MDGEGCVYVIGDVHGHARALEGLLAAVAEHGRGREGLILFLGDYIDRGPDSARVIAMVRELEGSGRAICLMGNHEQMLLRSLTEPLARAAWMREGGLETLASFGVQRADRIPAVVLDWLGSLPTQWQDERRIYVHAGLDPARSLERQTDWARLWIREPFVTRDHDFGLHVVHGHTVSEDGRADLQRFRTGLDTGCGYGGPLTAGVFDGDRSGPVALIQATAEGRCTHVQVGRTAAGPKRLGRRDAAAIGGIVLLAAGAYAAARTDVWPGWVTVVPERSVTSAMGTVPSAPSDP